MAGMQDVKGVALSVSKNSPAKTIEGEDFKEKLFIKADKIESDELEKDKLSQEEFKEVLRVAQNVIFGSDTHYEFKLHDKTNTMVCKLVNNETNEIVKEIPSEKILDMVAGIWELVGIIVDEKA